MCEQITLLEFDLVVDADRRKSFNAGNGHHTLVRVFKQVVRGEVTLDDLKKILMIAVKTALTTHFNLSVMRMKQTHAVL